MELVLKAKTTSPVWWFFGFEAGGDGNPKNEELAVCRIASECRKKTVMVRGGNTSNLLSHLRNHHPKEFMEVNQARKGKGAQMATKSSKGQASVADLIEREVKSERSSRKWKQLTDSVTFCLAKDMLPMYTVEKKGFAHLLKTLDPKYELPSRKYFSQTALPALYVETQDSVRSELEDIKTIGYFAATTDMWSSANSSPYISYMVHFLDDEWSLQSRCLQTMFMPDDHTGENIAEAMQAALDEWGLPEERQVCITTDSGSNIISATQKLQWVRLSCFGHNLHLAITNALKDDRRIDRAQGVCKKIVASFSNSWKKRDLTKVQEEKKLPKHSLITVST